MSDLISRQKLIENLMEYKVDPISDDDSKTEGYNDGIDLAITVISKIPSAEVSEIIHCKDCRYYDEDFWTDNLPIPIIAAHHVCHKWGRGSCKTEPDGYCFLGER